MPKRKRLLKPKPKKGWHKLLSDWSRRQHYAKQPNGVLAFADKIHRGLDAWKELEEAKKKFGFEAFYTVHGVAWEKDGKAIVLSGARGVGKSSLLRELEGQKGLKGVDDSMVVLGRKRGRLYVVETGLRQSRQMVSLIQKALRSASFVRGVSSEQRMTKSQARWRMKLDKAIGLASEFMGRNFVKDRSGLTFQPQTFELRHAIFVPNAKDSGLYHLNPETKEIEAFSWQEARREFPAGLEVSRFKAKEHGLKEKLRKKIKRIASEKKKEGGYQKEGGYRAPEVIKTEPEPLSSSDATVYRKEGEPFMFYRKEKYGFGSNTARKEEEIASLLRAHGLNVARHYPVGKKALLTRPLGKRLNSVWVGLDAKTKKEIAVQYAKMLGKMHALGVVHNHPHAGNLTWDGRRLGLIDFKFADALTFKELYERGPLGMSPSLSRDLQTFRHILVPLIGKVKPYLKILVEQYPLTAKEKKEFLEKMER